MDSEGGMCYKSIREDWVANKGYIYYCQQYMTLECTCVYRILVLQLTYLLRMTMALPTTQEGRVCCPMSWAPEALEKRPCIRV